MSRAAIRHTVILATAVVAAAAAHPAAALPVAILPTGAEQWSADSLVVTPAWLASRLDDPGVVVLYVTHAGSEPRARIPGARTLSYHHITEPRGEIRAELPEPARLVELLEQLGVSDDSHVVIYGDEPPMATRALFTLAYVGVRRASLLDGGFAQWRTDGHRVSRDVPRVTRGRITTAPRPDIVAEASWIVERLGRPGIALLDTRTDEEYNGTGGRRGMPSAGHLEGAHQLQWEQLFEPGSHRLRDRDELARLYAERVRPGDTVVTYCWIGYRASATWLVARLLGYDAKMYDGSYQDWSMRGLPVVR